VVKVELGSKELAAVHEMAKSRGLRFADLIREWILEKIHSS
jgi:predicted DNA binding CopG/RHH family protein